MRVKVKATIIGNKHIEETIHVMSEDDVPKWLEKQYPGQVKNMCDITTEVLPETKRQK